MEDWLGEELELGDMMVDTPLFRLHRSSADRIHSPKTTKRFRNGQFLSTNILHSMEFLTSYQIACL
jgi:hypothetical protein